MLAIPVVRSIMTDDLLPYPWNVRCSMDPAMYHWRCVCVCVCVAGSVLVLLLGTLMQPNKSCVTVALSFCLDILAWFNRRVFSSFWRVE
jgi:hypothetical protein